VPVAVYNLDGMFEVKCCYCGSSFYASLGVEDALGGAHRSRYVGARTCMMVRGKEGVHVPEAYNFEENSDT